MRLLVTRPEPDAESLAERLRGLGHDVLVAPMLTVVPREEQAIDLAGVQVICFTSRNAVRIFADQSSERAIPVYVVGPGTAEEARAKGFLAIREGGGDGRALVEAVRDALSPLAGAVLHARGAAVAYDVAGALRNAGFTLREQVLYETLPVPALAPDVRQAWVAGTIDGVLLFSPRSAKTFATLLMDAGLAGGAKQVIAYCLSEAVQSAADLPWKAVRVAEKPDVPAMLRLLEGGEGAMADERKPDEQAKGVEGQAKGGDAAKPAQTPGPAKPAEAARDAAPADKPGAPPAATPPRPPQAATPSPSAPQPPTPQPPTPQPPSPQPPSPGSAAPASPASGPPSEPQQDERGSVEEIIAKFGGLRPMATKLNLAVSTVQGWKIRGHIPEQRHDEILKAAKEHGIAVSAADLQPPAGAPAAGPAAATAKAPEAKTRSPLPTTGPRPSVPASGAPAASAQDASAKDKGEPDKDQKAEAPKPAVPSQVTKDQAAKTDDTPKEAAAAAAAAQASAPADAARAHRARHHEEEQRGAHGRPQGRRGGFLPGLLVGAVLIVGGAIAAVALRENWMPLVAGTQAPAGDTSQLQQQVQSLTSELDTLKQQTAALSQKADSLESSISGLSGQQGSSPADLSALQSSLQSLQAAGEKRAQDLASLDSALKAITGEGGLESKVSDLASKADGLTAATAKNEAGVANLTNEVRSVTGQVSGLGIDQLRSGAAALSTRLDTFENRLGTMEDQVRGQAAAERNALLLAVGQLDDAVAVGQPFAQSLSLVGSYAGDSAPAADMTVLQNYASSGVETMRVLRVRFGEEADAIIAADYDATADEGLFGEVVRNLSQLVIVRSRDPDDPGVNGVVSRTEAALNAGDLAGAVREVESLEGSPAQAAASWLAAAKDRLSVDTALASLAKALDATDAAPQAAAAESKNSLPEMGDAPDTGQDTSAAPAADDAATASAPATDDAATTTAAPAADDATTASAPATDDASATTEAPAADDAPTTAPAGDATQDTSAAPATDDAAPAAPATEDAATTAATAAEDAAATATSAADDAATATDAAASDAATSDATETAAPAADDAQGTTATPPTDDAPATGGATTN